MAMLLQVVSVAIILIVQATDVQSWLGKVPGINQCGIDNGCYSLQIAYRVGFATACVFAFQLVFSLLGRCFANKVLNSFWVFKFLFVIGGAGVFLLIPNAAFSIWVDVADVILGWFLIIQVVWIIDFAFGWNDVWITNAAEDRTSGKSGKAWFIGILFFAVTFLVGAYTWYGFMFADYADVHSNKTILAINVGVSTVLGIVSVFSPRGGILPASLVVLYVAWLSWSTVLSGAPLVTSDARLGIGLTLAAVVLTYSSYQVALPQVASNAAPSESPKKATVSSDAVQAFPAGEGVVAVSAPSQESMEEGVKTKPVKPVNEEVGSCRYILIMNSMHLSAACYLMNLCLMWSHSPKGGDDMIAYWVQAVAAWGLLTVYAWTLVAPMVCPSRQF